VNKSAQIWVYGVEEFVLHVFTVKRNITLMPVGY